MTTILLSIVFLALLLFMPVALTRRAVRQVLEIFRKKQALSPENAKTIDELGLRPLSFRQRLFRARDYKPRAMNALVQAEVILSTEDGRLYLSEARLADAKTEKR